MDIELLFMNIKFAMADDFYSNIKIEKFDYLRDFYIIKAEDVKKPQSIFTCVLTPRHIDCIKELGKVTICVLENNFFKGATYLDKEYVLHYNGNVSSISTGRNTVY